MARCRPSDSTTPYSGRRAIKDTRLGVSTARTLKLVRTSLATLGIDLARYGERDYTVTQKIGAALAFLGLDGLIAPSARWTCDNLMVSTENHTHSQQLDAIDAEEIEWRAWARDHGMVEE